MKDNQLKAIRSTTAKIDVRGPAKKSEALLLRRESSKVVIRRSQQDLSEVKVA